MLDIQYITIEDIDACYKIVRDNWDKEKADRFLNEVSQVWSDMAEPPIYYVAKVDGEVVGFAGMIKSMIMFGVWDLIWINVKQEFQGERIGTALTEQRLREILDCDGRAVHLMTKNPSFFNRFGFNVVKEYGEVKLMVLWLGPIDF